MSVEHVEILVEEPSAEAALRILLPKILNDISFEIYPHSCKDELLVRLPSRLRGYAAWLPPNWRVIVVVDKDDDDCAQLKQKLENLSREAGLGTKTAPKAKRVSVINRLAIEELEAWYFGDWQAVRCAYPRVAPGVPKQAAYRVPDAIKGGTWEAFERILQRAGYFKTGLRKIEAARALAFYMDPARNTSQSFGAFYALLKEMTSS
jgi:hypothetical protein